MYIDIRDSYIYNKGHIDGAVNIPFFKLFKDPKKYLSKNNTYYIYCQSGQNSKILVNYLNGLGYSCVNVNGGYSKYLLK